MSREIKFRVWDKKFQEWIRDGFSAVSSDGKILCYRSGGICPGWVEEYDQDSFVIQQFTGLKDKNDKEIYEGDIINIEGFCNFEVYWDDVYHKFSMFQIQSQELYTIDFDELSSQYIEIRGNFFENPELLK